MSKACSSLEHSRTTLEPASSINERAFGYYAALRRARLYVIQHFSEKITLEAVARVAGMERTYFSAFFHRKVGISFREWLSRLRVQEAMSIMSECDDSIAQVGRAVGFGQIRNFERAFKKTTHQTPVQYKRENRCHYGFAERSRVEVLNTGHPSNPL